MKRKIFTSRATSAYSRIFQSSKFGEHLFSNSLFFIRSLQRFPLTPARSLGERGNRRQAHDHSKASRWAGGAARTDSGVEISQASCEVDVAAPETGALRGGIKVSLLTSAATRSGRAVWAAFGPGWSSNAPSRHSAAADWRTYGTGASKSAVDAPGTGALRGMGARRMSFALLMLGLLVNFPRGRGITRGITL